MQPPLLPKENPEIRVNLVVVRDQKISPSSTRDATYPTVVGREESRRMVDFASVFNFESLKSVQSKGNFYHEWSKQLERTFFEMQSG